MMRRGLLLATLLGALSTLASAIYPDDHWDYATRLTADNFKDTIQTEIDAGKTMFVRWIASPG